MKVHSIIFGFIVLLLHATAARAQIDWAFSGYVADVASYAIPSIEGSDNAAINLSRFRMRPSLQLWEGSSIVLEHETDVLWSSIDRRSPFNPAEPGNRQAVDARWRLHDDKHLAIEHYIDRLYYRQNLEWGSIIAGRQRIQWGTGRVWNPTDLFNPINPASYDKIEKDGADAVSVKLHLGQFTDLQVVYNARPNFDSSNYGVRFRTNAAEYDASVVAGWFDRRPVIGGDLAGNLFNAGVRAELAWTGATENTDDDAFLRCILGADYQINAEVYLLFEYLFNGTGINDPKRYDLTSLLLGRILNVNRKYFYLGSVWQMHPLISGSAGFNANINDGSGFLLLSATCSSSENSVLIGGLLLPMGENGDEFRYYPTSFYLRGEVHF